MPCYTLIKVLIKNKQRAEDALKEMNIEGNIVKSGNQYSVELTNGKYITEDFKGKFLQEYGIQVATHKAKREGYSVARCYNPETQDIDLFLRQY